MNKRELADPLETKIQSDGNQSLSLCKTIVDGSAFASALNVTMSLFLLIRHHLAAKSPAHELAAKDFDSLMRDVTWPRGDNAKPDGNRIHFASAPFRCIAKHAR